MAVVTHRRAWCALLIALALAVMTGQLLPRSASASAATFAYTGDVTNASTVYSDTVSHGDGTRVPDIASTSASHAVVAWREGIIPGHVDQGYIRYAYTTDGGQSWSTPRTLAQETSRYTWHSVILFRTGGDIFAYLGRSDSAAANTGGIPNTIIVKHSTDEGHSWQDYGTDINDLGLVHPILSGHPVQLGNTFVLPYWASGRENGVLFSSDLSHWSKGGHPTNGNGATMMAGENELAVSQDNSADLVMVARAATPGHSAATATSHNGGQNWCEPVNNPGNCIFTEAIGLPSYDIARGFFTKDANGQYLYIYNSGTTKDDRDQLAYKVKPRGGAWSAAASFVDTNESSPTQPDGKGAGWDTYPMGAEYAPGKFFVVWESDTMHIEVGKLDVSGATR